MRIRKIFSILLSINGLLLISLSLLAYFNRKHEVFYDDSNKSWSHRGVAIEAVNENTLASIDRAFKDGYAGVEIDIWYHDHKFFVRHDNIEKDEELFLEEVFSTFPGKLFWLDLKNLNGTNFLAIEKSLNRFDKPKSEYLVESKSSIPLSYLSHKGFYCSYWIYPTNKGNSGISSSIRTKWRDFIIGISSFSALSMPLKDFSQSVDFIDFPAIHLWTDNCRKSLEYKVALRNSQVKIILDDQEKYLSSN